MEVGVDEVGATRAVARYIVEATLEDAPDGVAEIASKAIADTVAGIIAGATSDVAPYLATYLQRNPSVGPATILGWASKVGPETAALVNGTLGHALDYDDVVTIYTGHPSVVIVPAMLAVTGTEAIDGRRFLEAYVVGSEAGAQIARGIGLGHYHRGWHATATLCMFSALGAVAKLRRLTEDEICTAIGIASSLSAGLQRNFGTMTKPLHAGWAARNALVAVELASIGWSANTAMLETSRGFYEVYGDEGSDPAKVAPALGHPHVLVDPGLALKKYPCCWASHRAIDAVLDICAGRSADEVARLECHLPPEAFKQLQYHRPVNALEAKFSAEYALAAALLDGAAGLAAFKDAKVTRPEIAALYERIDVTEDAACSGEVDPSHERAPGEIGFIVVAVHFVDGSVEEMRVDAPIGSASKPMSWGDVREKFLDCAASSAMDPGAAERLFDAFEKLETVDDIGAVIAEFTLPASAFVEALSV